MPVCHIALGSNLGNRSQNLTAALELIDRLPGTRVVRASRRIETVPVGGPSEQPAYLNAAAELQTELSPRRLLEGLQSIEDQLGRVRRERWGPRPIDIDILLVGNQRIDEPGLTVPHPEMHYRRFVLEPLVEIAPAARHPNGWTIAERWDRVNRLPHYLAFTGPMGVGKTTVARRLAERLGAELVLEEYDSVGLGKVYAGAKDEGPGVQQQFVASRRALLDAERWAANPPTWLVSDFWFEQSLAYAELLELPEEALRHRERLQQLASEVISPTLVIWLDAPVDQLMARIASRGRAFESTVSAEFLAQLQDGYGRLLSGLGAPAVYRPRSDTIEELTGELEWVAAAISG